MPCIGLRVPVLRAVVGGGGTGSVPPNEPGPGKAGGAAGVLHEMQGAGMTTVIALCLASWCVGVMGGYIVGRIEEARMGRRKP